MNQTLVQSEAGSGANPRESRTDRRRASLDLLPAVPAALVVVAMLATFWPDGAFATQRWTLLAILVIGVLAVGAASGGDRRLRVLPVVLLWGFAAWAALSMIWATSPQRAWESAGRAALYAGAVGIPLLAIPRRRDLTRIAALVIVGLGLVVAVALVATLFRGEAAFLAGRLDEPLDYRNGAACLMAMAFWPLVCTAAARAPHPLLRVLGGALAGGALALGYLTQSRGALIALVAGGIVVLAMGPERRRRLWIALVLGAGVAVLSHPLQAPYHGFVAGHSDPGADLRTAAGAVAGLVALGAALGALAWAGDRKTGARAERTARRVSDVAVVLLVIAAVVGGLAVTGNPITTVRDKVHEFKTLEPATPTNSRLGTVGGQRYDLWRIALGEWRAHPFRGVGAGNYLFAYFRDRRTDRNLSDAHSLPLALLDETGVVGAALFLGALGILLVALVRQARQVSPPQRRWAGALAAAAIAVLAQSLVDWMHLLPALFGLALLCLALATRLVSSDEEPVAPPVGARRSRLPVLLKIVAIAPGLIAVVAVGMLYVADAHVREARDATTPAARLAAARDAARFDPVGVTPLYLEAGAEEDLGRLAASRTALDKALRLEPGNFATLGLLGDFELRRGHPRSAHGYYRRALAENPRDSGLRQLVRRTGG